MCLPAAGLAIASLAIGAASSAYQYYQSNQQANQAASLQQQSYDLQRQQLQTEYDRQAQDASIQYQRAVNQQAAKVDAQNAQYDQLSRQYQAASSTAAARAAEGGVGGISVDALMSDYYRQELDSRLALDTERNSIAMQGSNNLYDYNTGRSRADKDYVTNQTNLGLNNQSQMLKINDSRTSPVQLGLNLASSAVNSGSMYYRMKQPEVGPSRLPSKSSIG